MANNFHTENGDEVQYTYPVASVTRNYNANESENDERSSFTESSSSSRFSVSWNARSRDNSFVAGSPASNSSHNTEVNEYQSRHHGNTRSNEYESRHHGNTRSSSSTEEGEDERRPLTDSPAVPYRFQRSRNIRYASRPIRVNNEDEVQYAVPIASVTSNCNAEESENDERSSFTESSSSTRFPFSRNPRSSDSASVVESPTSDSVFESPTLNSGHDSQRHEESNTTFQISFHEERQRFIERIAELRRTFEEERKQLEEQKSSLGASNRKYEAEHKRQQEQISKLLQKLRHKKVKYKMIQQNDLNLQTSIDEDKKMYRNTIEQLESKIEAYKDSVLQFQTETEGYKDDISKLEMELREYKGVTHSSLDVSRQGASTCSPPISGIQRLANAVQGVVKKRGNATTRSNNTVEDAANVVHTMANKAANSTQTKTTVGSCCITQTAANRSDKGTEGEANYFQVATKPVTHRSSFIRSTDKATEGEPNHNETAAKSATHRSSFTRSTDKATEVKANHVQSATKPVTHRSSFTRPADKVTERKANQTQAVTKPTPFTRSLREPTSNSPKPVHKVVHKGSMDFGLRISGRFGNEKELCQNGAGLKEINELIGKEMPGLKDWGSTELLASGEWHWKTLNWHCGDVNERWIKIMAGERSVIGGVPLLIPYKKKHICGHFMLKTGETGKIVVEFAVLDIEFNRIIETECLPFSMSFRIHLETIDGKKDDYNLRVRCKEFQSYSVRPISINGKWNHTKLPRITISRL